MAVPATNPSRAGLAETGPKILGALGSVDTYGQSGPVEVCETHASWVFLVGDRAYKIKKPVALGFLDYSTLSARHEACREEVAVNRELAPDIYLGVRAIIAGVDGLRLAGEDSQEALEYAVEMRRFEESATLAGLIDAGALERSHVREVGQRLARFHASAPIAGGGAERVLASWRRNVAELERLRHDQSWRLDLLASFGESFVGCHRREIEQRAAEGQVRDGHGDLRCEHVLLEPSLAILDRIEFDPALREVDVCADLAFLAMDLESRGQGWAARELVDAYRAAGGDPGGHALRSYYSAERALVRVKVSLLDAAEHEGPRHAAQLTEAQRLLALAERLCWRARQPLVILLCGPPASGKSTLAAELSRRSGMVVLSSDVVRKRLAGVPAGARAGPEHYSEDFTRATYACLAEQALERLLGDGGVILDASAHSPGQRATLLDRLAGRARCLTVYCRASPRLTMRRASLRMSDAQRVSDASPRIAAHALREFQAPDEMVGPALLRLDTATALAEQAARVTHAADALCADGR
jgi:uncharacterized protein